ncbi:hypothetical protein ACLBKU_01990 [Erythrobacter sp. NE805]|uniref:hypothetical protein n=1 Tax=Erythrobacter sp. NE805 TaxID=3389875 RepID=UPI00396B0529
MKTVLTLAAALLAAACAPAQMRLSPGLAAGGEVLAVEGIGGGNAGRFYVGPWQGSFRRSEERLAVAETFVTRRAGAGFIIEGPGISETIEADCRLREREIALDDDVSFTPERMAYRCAFTAEGRAFPARFELQEARTGVADALNRRQRRGEIALGGEVVQMRSVHRLKGSPFEMASPIGYVFEQNGREVAAVELNGKARLILADPANESLSRTVTIAALALALLRDPADSMLG